MSLLRQCRFVFPVVIYAIISWFMFGHQILPHLTTYFIGNKNGDGWGHIWIIGVLKYGFSHIQHLIVTPQIWAPIGFNLAHTSNLLGVGLINYLFGFDRYSVIGVYNIWMLCAPICAAWSAFFLCFYISKNYTASILGGYVFGFSTY